MDKELSLDFLQRLSRLRAFSKKVNRLFPWLGLFVACYFVLSQWIFPSLPHWIYVAIVISFFCYIMFCWFGDAWHALHLRCPRCSKKFFYIPPKIPTHEREKCVNCGLKLYEIEDAAAEKLPFLKREKYR